ncbi:NAD(P)H-binding protein [Allokutzneria oryzae]|uniref:NAD(P)H-binding protein n=1 Tax=Allokutzneria oryzae TaxID=1378989 RepID=A0ABV5ZT83_9PSEU
MIVTVLGATGRTGVLVVRLLLEQGHTVRGAVRDEEKALRLKELGADPVRVDVATGDGLAEAFAGADAVINAAGNAERAREVDNAGAIAAFQMAERAGVGRYVQISSMYADRPSSGPPFLLDVLRAKQISDDALATSGMRWTVLRPGGLDDTAPAGAVTVGERLPGGVVSRADVAAVAVACLTADETECRAFDLVAGASPIQEALALDM